MKRAVFNACKLVGWDVQHLLFVTPSDAELADLLASLDTGFRAALESLYRGEEQLGKDGRLHPIDRRTRTRASQGMWLHDFCVANKPRRIAEIGMAYGYSTLFFLAAIARNGQGHLTSIDPLQHGLWKGIGLSHAERSQAPTDSFRFVEDRGDRAYADFSRAGETFDLIFIDGNHRFDDVLVDFYLYSMLCRVGGHVVLDDTRMPSIRSVVSFIRSNRADFVEVHTRESNISVFRKISEDVRAWQHFNRFAV